MVEVRENVSFLFHWRNLVARQPTLSRDDAKMTMAVAEFKRQLERAYTAGAEDRQEGSPLDFDGLFSSFFGNKKDGM